MSVLCENTIIGASGVADTGYTIDQSLRFNDDDSAYLSRTPASAGNRKTWTWSGWVKRGNLGIYTRLFAAGLPVNDDYLIYRNVDGLHFGCESITGTLRADNVKFRDPAQWYHVMAVLDTSNATSGDRMRLYVNGERITDFSTETYPAQNAEGTVNTTTEHDVGRDPNDQQYWDGYLADVHFIDGQALTPSDFGETDDTYGHWKAKEYEGTYGTNGFYLDFADSADLGNDVSGEGNDWTTNNLAATDQMLDSPTNNFATWNAVDTDPDTLSEGNLKSNGDSVWKMMHSTFAVSSGQWYWEELVQANNADYLSGIADVTAYANSAQGTSNIEVYDNGGGGCRIVHEGSYSVITGGYAGSGSIMGFALDMDAMTLKYYLNGVLKKTQSLDSSFATVSPAVSKYHSSPSVANFGQDSSFAGNKTAQSNADDNGYGDFYYSPPTGYLALCTQNLDDPADGLYADGQNVGFNTLLYTGNGSTRSITGVGFQPDLVWTKARDITYSNLLVDSVRGATKELRANGTNAEATNSGVTAFNSDGYSLGSYVDYNGSGNTYVSWNWKANGSGSSNTDGSITSTVSANVAAGQSIVSYTGNGTSGATVGHGLSSAPELMIIKSRNTAGDDWAVYHEAMGNLGFMALNNTTAKTSSSVFWNSTSPTSTVLTLGNNTNVNRSSEPYIAYCFHSVEGYSKVGSYTGNGNANGIFLHTGFAPRYFMYKRTDAAHNWYIYDSERSTFNVLNEPLQANTSNTEGTDAWLDFTSNGIKIRTADNSLNLSGGDYIFIAFAENPFKYSNAR